ncbi:phosphinothricin acetyltransferase [Terribacillus halophilus]|uniref:Phosphinothricin acetyltransferase n=1 Tax=Terribacillus halophilus TaxID=361279 RepID=A0A1G6T2W9_9BACI|nr:GNAT family N-acetyltransferase [Terribacillus halophilus]SDD23204.1 phosphinothricin acetyltransferase [Terribacillus halophilus]
MLIRILEQRDWPAVKQIYQDGMDGGNATFETNAPDWEEWNKSKLPFGRLVANQDGIVTGWVALTPYSSREVYRGVADISIYIHPAYQGRGVGRKLMKKLLEICDQQGIWTVQASIFPENTASLALHKSCGFREVGIRERIGKLYGRWRDVMLLERRMTYDPE